VVSLPDEVYLRTRVLIDFPNAGEFSQILAPYIPEQNLTVGNIGLIAARSCTWTAHPEDPYKTIMTVLEVRDFSGWRGSVMRQMVLQMATWPLPMVANFKKHPIFHALRSNEEMDSQRYIEFLRMA
jgi:hypothetical protein